MFIMWLFSRFFIAPREIKLMWLILLRLPYAFRSPIFLKFGFLGWSYVRNVISKKNMLKNTKSVLAEKWRRFMLWPQVKLAFVHYFRILFRLLSCSLSNCEQKLHQVSMIWLRFKPSTKASVLPMDKEGIKKCKVETFSERNCTLQSNSSRRLAKCRPLPTPYIIDN